MRIAPLEGPVIPLWVLPLRTLPQIRMATMRPFYPIHPFETFGEVLYEVPVIPNSGPLFHNLA